MFYRRNPPETSAKLSVQLIAGSRLAITGAAVAVSRNIGFPRGLQLVSRYATVTVITGPTFMSKIFYDEFPLDWAALLMSSPQRVPGRVDRHYSGKLGCRLQT